MVRPSFLLQLCDAFLAVICLILAHYLRYGRLSSETLIFEGGIFNLAAYVVVVLTMVVSLFALSALFYIIPGIGFWRGVLLISLFLCGFCQLLVRSLIRKF